MAPKKSPSDNHFKYSVITFDDIVEEEKKTFNNRYPSSKNILNKNPGPNESQLFFKPEPNLPHQKPSFKREDHSKNHTTKKTNELTNNNELEKHLSASQIRPLLPQMKQSQTSPAPEPQNEKNKVNIASIAGDITTEASMLSSQFSQVAAVLGSQIVKEDLKSLKQIQIGVKVTSQFTDPKSATSILDGYKSQLNSLKSKLSSLQALVNSLQNQGGAGYTYNPSIQKNQPPQSKFHTNTPDKNTPTIKKTSTPKSGSIGLKLANIIKNIKLHRFNLPFKPNNDILDKRPSQREFMWYAFERSRHQNIDLSQFQPEDIQDIMGAFGYNNPVAEQQFTDTIRYFKEIENNYYKEHGQTIKEDVRNAGQDWPKQLSLFFQSSPEYLI